MNHSSKFVLIGVAVVMAAAGFTAAMFWKARHAAAPALLTGTLIEPHRPIPAFSLLDHHDRPFTQAQLRGHWSMLFFGYTNCPDLCPTTLTSLSLMHKRMRAAHDAVQPWVVFVSVDAKRDTPAQLARYVPFFDPEFTGVTAAGQGQIEAFARQLGVAVIIGPQDGDSYSVDHSGAVFVVAPDGNLAAVLTGPHTVDSLLSDFRRIVSAGA